MFSFDGKRLASGITACILFLCGSALVAASPKVKDPFHNLKFRNLGPAVAGGRVTAVEGIPGEPNVYYVGGAGGGVFKTVDGGLNWKEVFNHQATASVGAIAVAPSNPQYIWVGTGEANLRNDLITGAGVYFSPDGGKTWQFKGLRDAGQISSVIVDPSNPNVVFVGAIGHAWGPNTERGVFKTTDGGKTWKKILYIDDSTGVADLEMAPNNPEVLYAAMWHVRRYPWTMVDGGPTSGIYRTTDGGATWKKLKHGLPKGPLGRIAIAVAPSNPYHVYALIQAKKGMLWQSLDMGNHWTAVNPSHALDVRAFYFSKLAVSPDNENKIFALSFNLMESIDGGKTFKVADQSVHVDHHAIWIDPKNAGRIIQGNDGGVYLSTDGAKTWRFLDTLTLEQFYSVAVGPGNPYTICGGLQDNNAWCGLSTNLGGSGVDGSVWYNVVGGDGEYAVPAPSDPKIIYADAEDGFAERINWKSKMSLFIRPYLHDVTDTAPADLKYRFNWTTPIAVSKTDPNEVFLGGNVLFKSLDGGRDWTVISPDLTRNDKSKQILPGGPVNYDISGAETYDTILSLALAPTNPNVIWVGTDDGLVQVTRDGGKTWTNVTGNIPGAPAWAMVSQIGVSPFDAGTAYVAFDAHKLDNNGVYVYRTSDYGKTWTKITHGLPANDPAHVVREDPHHRGLLVLGDDTGLYYSLDDGSNWQPLKLNFPTTPVWDLKFVRQTDDLVVATHGRGVFVFDNFRPIENFTPQISAADFHLLDAGPGVLFNRWDSGSTLVYQAPNAPRGVTVDYYLKSQIKPTPAEKKAQHTPVKIVVTDAQGHVVCTRYGPSKAGVNRYAWNMRYQAAVRLKFEKEPPPKLSLEFPKGPTVVPGEYHISVIVQGKTQETTAEVLPDPTLHIPVADYEAEAHARLEVRNELTALDEMINSLDLIERQVSTFETAVADAPKGNAAKAKYSKLLKQAKALSAQAAKLKTGVFNSKVQRTAPEDSLHYLSRFHSDMETLAGYVSASFEQPPTAIVKAQMTHFHNQLQGYLRQYNAFLTKDVEAYNKAAYKAGASTIFAGGPITISTPK